MSCSRDAESKRSVPTVHYSRQRGIVEGTNLAPESNSPSPGGKVRVDRIRFRTGTMRPRELRGLLEEFLTLFGAPGCPELALRCSFWVFVIAWSGLQR